MKETGREGYYHEIRSDRSRWNRRNSGILYEQGGEVEKIPVTEEEMERQMTKREKTVFFILCLVALGQQLINVLINFDADTAYALTMSYRMTLGDRMIIDMWEPHQTSAFLLAALIKGYRFLTNSTTGIVLFANIMGVVINLLVVLIIYKVFKNSMDSLLLAMLCLFLVVIRPKGCLLPEFSNMQFWFLMLLFVCLVQYFDRGRKLYWLLLASLCLCLEIISYPSCLVIYLGVLIIFWLYSDRKMHDILCFSVACFVQGVLYLAYFLTRMGYAEFMDNISNILSGDSAHTGFYFRNSFFAPLGAAAVWLAACLVLSLIVTFVEQKVKKSEGSVQKIGYLIFQRFFIIALMTYGAAKIVRKIWLENTMRSWWLTLSALYLVAFGVAWYGLKYCSEQEKRQTVIGYILSAGALLAVITLTNLDFLSAAGYMIPAVMVTYAPVYRLIERQEGNRSRLWRMRGFLLLFLVISVTTSIDAIDCRGIVKKGPALGVVTTYMDALKMNTSVERWKDYVHPGDSLLVVGGGGLNTVEYMYEDTVISMHSVMCDPTYNETLLKYWEKHPERYPDVIAVESWYGDLRMEEDDWIMQWIEKEYQPSGCDDTDFWRFYRKDL